jgi:hypothetical protein
MHTKYFEIVFESLSVSYFLPFYLLFLEYHMIKGMVFGTNLFEKGSGKQLQGENYSPLCSHISLLHNLRRYCSKINTILVIFS